MSELKLYQFQGVIMEQFCPVCKGSPETSPQKHSITKQCAGRQEGGIRNDMGRFAKTSC